MTETGMSALVSALTSNITLTAMLENVTTLIPWIAGLVIFAFIYRLIRRSVKGASTGKVKM